MAYLDSVNVGAPRPNPFKRLPSTGIAKQPHEGPVWARDPGPRGTGLGSGLIGDFIGDLKNHGGRDQAVYAYGREDLDFWESRLGRPLTNGIFGENLTTRGVDVNNARLGERWRVGQGELTVTCPRIPCPTFRGWVGERGWLKTFTKAARPGTYLAVTRPGWLAAGDSVSIVHRPAHDVTVSLAYRAITSDPELLVDVAALAWDDLIEELRHAVRGHVAET